MWLFDRMSRETVAKLACVYSGIAWGLFWIPLRWLEAVGVEGPWIGVIFFTIQLVFVAPLVFIRSRSIFIGDAGLHLTSFFAGAGMALYALSVVYSDVIHAILLFYLTPIWSTLLARIVLKEPITFLRALAIVLGIAGMLVIFKVNGGVSGGIQIGDAFGLAAGIMWAIAAVRLRTGEHNDTFELSYGFYLWGSLFCILGAMLPLGFTFQAPNLAGLSSMLIWIGPLIIVIAFPGVVAAMWGPKYIDPGLVGILFMSEIVVGAITVAIWADEPFGLREILGIILISSAGLLESVFDYVKHRRLQTQ